MRSDGRVRLSPSRPETGITADGTMPSAPSSSRKALLDRGEARPVEIHHVHLGDGDGDLADAQQMQQIAVPPRLVGHALDRVDHHQRGGAVGRAGDHVAQEGAMARRVDQRIMALVGREPDMAHVDGDALVALGLEGVGDERPFERHAALAAGFLQRLDLALGQGVGLVQQPADQGRLAVVDMADDDDAKGVDARPLRGIQGDAVHADP